MILLCTYNEAGNIQKMFDQIAQHLPAADVLVVDDNSPDGTGDLVRSASETDSRYHLLSRSGKQGLGTATRAGLMWGVEHQYDFVINMDADLSHDPASLPAVFDAVASQPEIDVAVGSRYVPGGGFAGLAWHRKVISKMLNGYATRILRLPIKDCSGSFRCYRGSALAKLDFSQLNCPGYGFLEEILVALKDAGCQFTEVPIQFELRNAGQSKLSWRDAAGAIRVIHQLALRR
ncbi:MAG: polyprenol monophosphomannose synthase [Aureliella sp.]